MEFLSTLIYICQGQVVLFSKKKSSKTSNPKGKILNPYLEESFVNNENFS